MTAVALAAVMAAGFAARSLAEEPSTRGVPRNGRAEGPGGNVGEIAGAETAAVVVVSTQSYRTSIAMAGGGHLDVEPGAHGGLYVISGTLRNVSTRPVHHVALRFDLVDAGGHVVFREEGYNFAAESLLRPQEKALPTVVEIPPAGTDRYRMVFFADELPRFERAVVTVIGVYR